jgi:hypothetical protein
VRKHRKLLIALACLVLIAGIVAFATPDNEPHYQGRSLSEWLDSDDPTHREVQVAVRAIGTNAIPFLMKWLRYEPGALKKKAFWKLPDSIRGNRVAEFLLGDNERYQRPFSGFHVLNTNAAVAIPELTAMMHDTANPRLARRSISALGHIGAPALPALLGGLSDTNFPHRYNILAALYLMCKTFGTNDALPPLHAALYDPDPQIQERAANHLGYIAPELLTNTPAR